jgi:hypothetical protein
MLGTYVSCLQGRVWLEWRPWWDSNQEQTLAMATVSRLFGLGVFTGTAKPWCIALCDAVRHRDRIGSNLFTQCHATLHHTKTTVRVNRPFINNGHRFWLTLFSPWLWWSNVFRSRSWLLKSSSTIAVGNKAGLLTMIAKHFRERKVLIMATRLDEF